MPIYPDPEDFVRVDCQVCGRVHFVVRYGMPAPDRCPACGGQVLRDGALVPLVEEQRTAA